MFFRNEWLNLGLLFNSGYLTVPGTTMRRTSWSGSMRKITQGSYPWRREETWKECLKGSAEVLNRYVSLYLLFHRGPDFRQFHAILPSCYSSSINFFLNIVLYLQHHCIQCKTFIKSRIKQLNMHYMVVVVVWWNSSWFVVCVSTVKVKGLLVSFRWSIWFRREAGSSCGMKGWATSSPAPPTSALGSGLVCISACPFSAG